MSREHVGTVWPTSIVTDADYHTIDADADFNANPDADFNANPDANFNANPDTDIDTDADADIDAASNHVPGCRERRDRAEWWRNLAN